MVHEPADLALAPDLTRIVGSFVCYTPQIHCLLSCFATLIGTKGVSHKGKIEQNSKASKLSFQDHFQARIVICTFSPVSPHLNLVRTCYVV